jgi:Flp pilus assembly pilin Flp
VPSDEGGLPALIHRSLNLTGAKVQTTPQGEVQMRIGAQFVRAIAAGVLADDSGQDLIEYALLTAIVGISGVLILSALSTTMSTAYSSWNTAGQNAWQPCPPQSVGPCS